VARTLIDHAYERRATLLLVGRSGARRALKRVFMRSVAEQLIAAGQGLEISIFDQQRTPSRSSGRATRPFE